MLGQHTEEVLTEPAGNGRRPPGGAAPAGRYLKMAYYRVGRAYSRDPPDAARGSGGSHEYARPTLRLLSAFAIRWERGDDDAGQERVRRDLGRGRDASGYGGVAFPGVGGDGQERGRPFSRDDFANTFGRRNPEIIHILFGDAHRERGADLADRKELLYREAAGQGVALLPGVRALLEDLDRAGFRQAIGSSALRDNLELILRLTGVEQFFPAVIAMEDTQRGKPDPQVFQFAAQRLGVPPERCVVLEDAVAGVQAARAGGMKCIAVRFVGHHSEEALREAGADLVASSWSGFEPDRTKTV